jgi:hypothetical protein
VQHDVSLIHQRARLALLERAGFSGLGAHAERRVETGLPIVGRFYVLSSGSDGACLELTKI